MGKKIKNNFKAIEFMRNTRNELSELYHADKKRYRDELKKTMEYFLTARRTFSTKVGIESSEG
jgi:hypothetical protein